MALKKQCYRRSRYQEQFPFIGTNYFKSKPTCWGDIISEGRKVEGEVMQSVSEDKLDGKAHLA